MRRLAAVVALAAGCGLPDGDYFGRIADIDPHHFTWCNQGEPDHFDPGLASSTVSTPLVNALFAGLSTYGPDGNPVPSLGTLDPRPGDLRTFVFHLRRDARWTNGRALTAYDVAYSAMRVAHPLTASPNADNVAPLKNATAYLARRVFVMRRDVGALHAGEVVELAGAAAPAVNARTASHPLALRDLGAGEDAAYAEVPADRDVELVWTTGGRATPSSPDGRPWAYVFWSRDRDGVYGWVPAAELDGEPHADDAFAVRRVPMRDQPGRDASDLELAVDDALPRFPVRVRGRDVLHSPDAIGVRVPDAYTVVFECSDPTPFFLALTANRALRTAPSEVVSRWPRSWDRPGRIATSGPLHLVAWRERDRVELVRSPSYWDPSEVRSDSITALSVDDQAAATNLYYTGACDATATNTVPSTYLPALDGELRPAYRDYRVDPYLTVYFAWINVEKVPNRHLRRAMSLAVDRTQIPRFTHGNEIPTAQLTPGAPIATLSPADLAACGVTRDTPGVALVMTAGELCYVPPPGLDFDLEAARREVALAKQEMGAAWREPLEYRFNSGSEAHKQIAEYLQAAWRRIGVEVVVTAQEFNSLLDDTRKGNYEAARLGSAGQIADTESEFLPLFRCGSPDNRGRYCNPEFERLMDAARPIRDRRARNAMLRRAEAVVLADAPIVPIYVYTQKHLIKPYVRDYAINLVDQPALWRVWNDPSWKPQDP